MQVDGGQAPACRTELMSERKWHAGACPTWLGTPWQWPWSEAALGAAGRSRVGISRSGLKTTEAVHDGS